VVVYNGAISGFSFGVVFGESESPEKNCELRNVRVLGANEGVRMSGSDNLVENCSIVGTGESDSLGITISGPNAEVRNCNISQMNVGIVSLTGIGGGAYFHNYIASCTNGLELDRNDFYQGNVVTNTTQAFAGGNAVGTENGGH
jgi:hypothetical protein